MSAAQRLESAVTTFLESLESGRRAQATRPFPGDERQTWAYTPRPRTGVPLWALSRAQTKAAFRLLAAMVTPASFSRVLAVIGLEETLDQLEGARTDRRHTGDYWVALFGQPGDASWGVRFEGHHVSINATVVMGDVVLTPLFLDAHPAVVRDGAHVVLAPLQVEERLGFELVHALTTEQRSSAVLSEDAPADIVTGNRPLLGGPFDPVGVPLSALDGAATRATEELVRIYLGRFPDDVRRPPVEDPWFAWAGALEPGIGHYYRLTDRRLLVELDNTQHGANHVHTVVRDPDADFGEDLLAAHYRTRHPG
jgi:hypothetical protein